MTNPLDQLDQLLADGIKYHLLVELNKYQNGEIKWNVGNQFNESILESAIEHCTYEKMVAITKKTPNVSIHDIMTLANAIADFEAPELSVAWTN